MASLSLLTIGSNVASTPIDLSVVIVNWNTSALLRNCLESVFRTTSGLRFEVIVVDNGSTDDSVDVLRREFPQVRTILNAMNRGFAAANNQGIAASEARYVVLLNSDTVVPPDTLRRLVTFAEHNPSVGVVGPRLLNGDGTLQKSWARFPTVLSEILGKNVRAARPFRNGRYAEAFEVDSVGGACMLIRRTTFNRIGLLDEGYFMYSEEVDLCYRARERGELVCYLPETHVIHFGGQSARIQSRRMKAQLYRSKLIFFQKHYGHVRARTLSVLLQATFLARALETWILWNITRRRQARWKELHLDAVAILDDLRTQTRTTDRARGR